MVYSEQDNMPCFQSPQFHVVADDSSFVCGAIGTIGQTDAIHSPQDRCLLFVYIVFQGYAFGTANCCGVLVPASRATMRRIMAR